MLYAIAHNETNLQNTKRSANMKWVKNCIFIVLFIILFVGCIEKTVDLSETQTFNTPIDTTSALYNQSKKLFDNAYAFQKNEDYTSAIPLYQQLIHINPLSQPNKHPETVEKIGRIIDEGCLQLVYCYIFSGIRKDGALYFDKFYADNNNWLVCNQPRSVELYYAYSLYEATRLNEAVAMVDKALSRSTDMRADSLLYVDNGIASVIYNQAGAIHKAIECGERSLKILRKMEDKSKIVFVLGNLIYQYQQIGEFDKALASYNELMNSGEGENNPYGLCAAEVNMIHLYEEWGMRDEVELHLKKAHDATEKSKVPEAFLRVDNVAIYFAIGNGEYEKALALQDSLRLRMTAFPQRSYYQEFYDNAHSILSLRFSDGKEISVIAKAKEQLTFLTSKPLNNQSLLACRLLGDAFVDKGEEELALTAYLHCCNYVNENQLLNQKRLVYASLGQLYDKRKEYEKSSRYLLLAKKADATFTELRNARMMAQFRIKYEILEKEKANELLRYEIQLKERTLLYYTWLGISLLLLFLFFFGWFIMRQRALKLRHEADMRQHELDDIRHIESLRFIEDKEKQLRMMLVERQNLNRQNEELLGRLENIDTQLGLQEAITILSPRLLTVEEEQEFRHQFIAIYPYFLHKLREICQTITRGEELLSMLLRLNLSSEEIALALGNNRTSVNTARFRLRKKLGLDKEIVLDEFLRNLN